MASLKELREYGQLKSRCNILQRRLDEIDTSKLSNDELNKTMEEVKEISMELDSLKERIKQIEEYWADDLESIDEPTSEEVQRSKDWQKVDKNFLEDKEMRKLSSFGNDNYFEKDKIYLRKGEKFSSRFKQEEKGLSLQKSLKGIGLGIWEEGNEKRAIGSTGFGAILPTEISSKVIENAFNSSMIYNSDVPIVPMQTGSVTVPRVVDSSIVKPGFKAEGEEGQELSMSLEPINLTAKTCYGYVYLNNELLMKADSTSEKIINDTFAKAIAEVIDKACIYTQKDSQGTYLDYAPKGVWEDEKINKIEVPQDGSINYDVILDAIAEIEDKNYIASNIGMNSTNKKELNKLKNDVGDYLTPPIAYNELKKITTNQLEKDNLLVYNPNGLILGVMSNLVVRRIEDERAVKRNQVAFTFAVYMDFAVTMPKAICKIYKSSPSV